MAQLLVRNLSEEVVLALKRRAAVHGNSVEEEHRELLRSVLLPDPASKPDFKSLLTSIPCDFDLDLDRVPDRGRAVDL